MKMTSIAVALVAVACGGSHGKMRTDTPALPYQEPDIAEITGIPDAEPGDEVAPESAPTAQPAPGPTSAPQSVSNPAPAATAPTGKAPAGPKK